MLRIFAVVIALGAMTATPLSAQTIPTAVIADPAPDTQFPARLIQLRYTSAGIALPARLFLASGGKPHPTVLMLHGFPGTEMGAANADRWDWRKNAARLAGPLLLISSNDGLKPDTDAAVAEVTKAGGKVTEVKIETDHSYNDHRIALAAAIVGWLQMSFP